MAIMQLLHFSFWSAISLLTENVIYAFHVLQLFCFISTRNSYAKCVIAIVETSVRPSVCLSVTLLYCVKTTQAI